MNPDPIKFRDLDAAGRLILALGASLALHLALIVGVQVKAARQESGAHRTMQVRIEPQAGEVSSVALSAGEHSVAEATHESETVEPVRDQEEVPPPVLPALPAVEQANPLLPALEVPLLEDPTWYPAKQVDVHPTALYPIKPDYPDKGVEQGVEGNVVLLLLIDEAGAVKEATVVAANPEGIFEESALSAFREARFAPAQKNSRAVKSRVLIRVSYELNERKKPVVVQPPLPLTP
ncbi:MAG: energy transducer TonB [Sulfuricella sp.]